MKKIILSMLLCFMAVCAAEAQSQVKYGYLSYDALLRGMPEYAEAQLAMGELVKKYEAEASYNEMNFKRLFAEFLEGQKEFPQSILLKRQRDLQEAMEKGLAYRQSADSLLHAAKEELMLPLRQRLDSAICNVALERGYECVVNSDTRSHLFFSPGVAEDATPFVVEKLAGLKEQENEQPE
ncbi:MAG: OmpH family outer membrane protein [Bacteroidaceae bacterium]|nr:OmpH family outer membrane protein [Bacteroidaceae bacterium]